MGTQDLSWRSQNMGVKDHVHPKKIQGPSTPKLESSRTNYAIKLHRNGNANTRHNNYTFDPSYVHAVPRYHLNPGTMNQPFKKICNRWGKSKTRH